MTSIPQRQSETLRRILDGQRAELHTAMPGTVKSYDASAQTADIRPGLRRVIPSREETEDETVEELPILPSVPVVWPRAGDFFLHAPLQEGDGVLVIFSEADINAWLDGSVSANPSLPERHGLSGAVAIPGLFPSASPIGSVSAGNATMGVDGGPVMAFVSGEIRAGGADPLARESALDALVDALVNAPLSSGGGSVLTGLDATLGAVSAWVNKGTDILKGD